MPVSTPFTVPKAGPARDCQRAGTEMPAPASPCAA